MIILDCVFQYNTIPHIVVFIQCESDLLALKLQSRLIFTDIYTIISHHRRDTILLHLLLFPSPTVSRRYLCAVLHHLIFVNQTHDTSRKISTINKHIEFAVIEISNSLIIYFVIR